MSDLCAPPRGPTTPGGKPVRDRLHRGFPGVVSASAPHSTSIVTGPSPGVLFGIYRYERESESEFKAWSVDSLSEFARLLLAELQKRNKAAGNINVVHKFIRESCPEWSEWLKDQKL